MSTSRTREKADGELFKSTGIDDNATSTAVTIDANENVGIGSTPATDWHSNYSVLQVGGQADIWTHKAVGAGKALHISHNAEYDTGFKFIANDEATLYVQGDGAHRFSHGAYGTAGSAISFVERLKIDADGLTFKGNTGGAATALDDYEEGYYDPSVSAYGTSGAFGFAGNSNTLAYTKIGRTVHVQGYISITDMSGTDTGHLIMSLPFTAPTLNDDCGYNLSSVVLQNHGGSITGNVYLFINGSTAYFYKVQTDGSSSYIMVQHIDTTFQIGVSFTYLAA